jgi:SAM-dependent methyltransferase
MKTATRYIHTPETGVHLREGYGGIEYSDGADIEDRLLRDVLSCTDLTDGSDQLRRRIVDWPSEYHFSPLRANLLRPFNFKGLRVLELGCGCGAITRFLGEAGAQVVAVEGSPRRAAIAAARCRDLPNVSVYCDNLVDFSASFEFDVVTMIGVLEYSRLFVSGDDPVQRCLQLAAGHLDDVGALYVAIENQLGLKYFNGCREDHAGIAYFGINDRYRENTAVTFGRRELARRVGAAGFGSVEFYFPYPDYKLPEVILTEAAFVHEEIRVGDLLYRMRSRDNGAPFTPSFDENLAWQVLVRNGIAADLSNSFLVRASKADPPAGKDWLARCYSTGRRRQFAAQNIIREENGLVKVVKQTVFAGGDGQPAFEHLTGEQDYIRGDMLLGELQRIFSAGGGLSEMAAWALPWLEFLKTSAGGTRQLPPEYVDCIPANLIRDENGRLHYVDVEWRARGPIPLVWVAIRGVVLSLSACPPSASFGALTCRQIAAEVLARAGLNPEPREWEMAAQWERDLREQCYGDFGDPVPLGSRLELPWSSYQYTQQDLLRDRQSELEAYRKEVSRVKTSLSWRITKPVRLLQSLWRRIVN